MKAKSKLTRQRYADRKERKCVFTPLPIVSRVLGDECKYLEKCDEDLKRDIRQLGVNKVLMKSWLGAKTINIKAGNFSAVGTNVPGNFLFLSLSGTPAYVTFVQSSTVNADWTLLTGLFDEFKVEGLHCRFTPKDPFNRGSTIASNPIAVYFDDDSNNGTSVTWADHQQRPTFHTFSMDITTDVEYHRPRISEFPWSDCQIPGGQTSSLGSFGLCSNGNLTVSTTYGYANWQFFLLFRFRI